MPVNRMTGDSCKPHLRFWDRVHQSERPASSWFGIRFISEQMTPNFFNLFFGLSQAVLLLFSSSFQPPHKRNEVRNIWACSAFDQRIRTIRTADPPPEGGAAPTKDTDGEGTPPSGQTDVRRDSWKESAATEWEGAGPPLRKPERSISFRSVPPLAPLRQISLFLNTMSDSRHNGPLPPSSASVDSIVPSSH